jgi:membrane fusion protein, protease secretion system
MANLSMQTTEPDAPPEERKDERSYSRLGWILVLGGFVGSLVWAGFAPLDQGVPAPGVVVVDGQRKRVQHPTGGIIERIFVQDGDTVEAGDVLVKMNEVSLQAAKGLARSQWVNARAREGRLMAELAGDDTISFPQDLMALADDPVVERTLDLQRALLKSRRQVFNAEISAIEENIRGVRAQLAALDEANQGREAELAAVERQWVSLSGLAEEGYVSQNRVLDLERSRAQLQGALAGTGGERGRLQSQLGELKLALARRRDEAMREAQTELNDVQREGDTAWARLITTEFELDNVNVRAPASGVVVGMTVFTEGGVISGGDRLMEIVPEDQPLEVEAQVAVNLIDSVSVGLPVDLVFSALNLEKSPVVNGEVIHVSADRLFDEALGQPYFKVIVRATEEGVAQLKGQQVRPGMPVDVFIKTGERSLLNYLIKPLSDRAAMAMSEE